MITKEVLKKIKGYVVDRKVRIGDKEVDLEILIKLPKTRISPRLPGYYLAVAHLMSKTDSSKTAEYIMTLEEFIHRYKDCYFVAYYDLNTVFTNHIILNCYNREYVIGTVIALKNITNLMSLPVIVAIYDIKEIRKYRLKLFTTVGKLKNKLDYIIKRVSKHLIHKEVTEREQVRNQSVDYYMVYRFFENAKIKLYGWFKEYAMFLMSAKPNYYIIKIPKYNPNVVYIHEIDRKLFAKLCKYTDTPFKPISILKTYVDMFNEIIEEDNISDSD
jgi:hypothetical protein